MEEKRLRGYLDALQRVAKRVEVEIQTRAEIDDIKTMKGTEFEDVVFDALLQEGIKKENIFHSKQKFPDFVIIDEETREKIGVEVKKTNEKYKGEAFTKV